VNFAKSRRLVANDPLAGLRLREPKPTPQPCWTQDEVDRILATASQPCQPALMILADTGLRVGELKHLTWDDVDYANNVLHARAKDGWKPKTGDQRAVPMSPRVRALLEGLPQHSDSMWVVTAPPSPQISEWGPSDIRTPTAKGAKTNPKKSSASRATCTRFATPSSHELLRPEFRNQLSELGSGMSMPT